MAKWLHVLPFISWVYKNHMDSEDKLLGKLGEIWGDLKENYELVKKRPEKPQDKPKQGKDAANDLVLYYIATLVEKLFVYVGMKL